MKETALVIMAAGIGSRFGGGIKQLAKLGPHGEIIIDYSIHDALKAGFTKIIFIIRKDIEQVFREQVGSKYEGLLPVEYAFQDINDLPTPYSVPDGRSKPWGTAHAVQMAKDVIKEPFAVINGDDYYGKDSFHILADWLRAHENTEGVFSIVGFALENTLSESGGVSRGICSYDSEMRLTDVVEHLNIFREDDGVIRGDNSSDGQRVGIHGADLCSMNMWGFQPEFITKILEPGFDEYLGTITDPNAKGEYLLPTIVGGLLKKEMITVKVLKSHDTWYGVTYKEDSPKVRASIKALHDQGLYPEKL